MNSHPASKPESPSRTGAGRFWPLVLVVLLVAGCRSNPKPKSNPALLKQALTYDQQGQLSAERAQWQAAARNWRDAADTYALLNRLGDQALTLRKYAIALQQSGQWEAAHQAAERAAQMHKKLDDQEGWWRNQVLLIQIDAAWGRTEEVNERIQDLTDQLATITSPGTLALLLNEIGLWQMRQSEVKAAIQSYTGSVEAFWRQYDDQGMATALANRARAYEADQALPEAERDWEAALKIFMQQGDAVGISTALLGQARTLAAQNKSPERARDLAQRAAENFHRLNQPAAEAEARRLLDQL